MAEQPVANTVGTPQSPSGEASTGLAGRVLPQLGFVGNAKAKLDERGRLKLPVEFKAVLERKYGEGFKDFYITSQSGENADIYPWPEWEQRRQELLNAPAEEQETVLKMMEADLLFGDRVELDSQGRLLIPEELRNRGMVNQEVRIAGLFHKLRVISLDRLRTLVSENPVDKTDRSVLNRYGI